MGLGLSFGSSKTKSNTSGTMTKDETTNQQQTTNTTGTTTGSQTTTQNNSSQGTSTTDQTTKNALDSTKESQTTGQTNLFSGGVLSGLESLAGQLMTNLFNGKTNPAVATMGAFDPMKYVESTTAAAASKESSLVDSALGGVADLIGSAFGNNSMGTLLAGQIQGDSNTRLAKVGADAQVTANQITNANAQTQLAGQAQDTGLIQSILGALKGGSATTTEAGKEGTSGTNTSTATGSTSTNETSQNTAVTQSMQTIQQLVDALLTGTTKTVGTENSTTTGKNSSMGASLSL